MRAGWFRGDGGQGVGEEAFELFVATDDGVNADGGDSHEDDEAKEGEGPADVKKNKVEWVLVVENLRSVGEVREVGFYGGKTGEKEGINGRDEEGDGGFAFEDAEEKNGDNDPDGIDDVPE